MLPLHTSLYAGGLAVVYVWLSYRITVIRRGTRQSLGTGEDDALLRAVRVHGNFAEYVPFGLVLLALVEMVGSSGGVVHGFGGLLVMARALHALGLGRSAGISVGRFWGTALTFTMLAFAGLYLVGFASWKLASG